MDKWKAIWAIGYMAMLFTFVAYMVTATGNPWWAIVLLLGIIPSDKKEATDD